MGGPGTILTADQAIQIYRLKPRGHNADLCDQEAVGANAPTCLKGRSIDFARKYGVSSKAIRDIWNRRTWAFATLPLLQEEHSSTIIIEANGPSSVRVKS